MTGTFHSGWLALALAPAQAAIALPCGDPAPVLPDTNNLTQSRDNPAHFQDLPSANAPDLHTRPRPSPSPPPLPSHPPIRRFDPPQFFKNRNHHQRDDGFSLIHHPQFIGKVFWFRFFFCWSRPRSREKRPKDASSGIFPTTTDGSRNPKSKS